MNKPWECPRCGVMNAWWVARCNCKRAPKQLPATRSREFTVGDLQRDTLRPTGPVSEREGNE